MLYYYNLFSSLFIIQFVILHHTPKDRIWG